MNLRNDLINELSRLTTVMKNTSMHDAEKYGLLLGHYIMIISLIKGLTEAGVK